MAEENSEKSVPFEAAMAELEKTVDQMERGGVPLEEMMQKFEEGAKLAAYCQKKLLSLKQKMEILTKNDDNTAVWREMAAEETFAAESIKNN